MSQKHRKNKKSERQQVCTAGLQFPQRPTAFLHLTVAERKTDCSLCLYIKQQSGSLGPGNGPRGPPGQFNNHTGKAGCVGGIDREEWPAWSERTITLVPEQLMVKINNHLCGHIIRSVFICLGCQLMVAAILKAFQYHHRRNIWSKIYMVVAASEFWSEGHLCPLWRQP